MEKWVTASEASRILDVTERTIQRYVKEEKYQSKLEDGRRYILIDLSEDVRTDDAKGKLMVQMEDEIKYLREELSNTMEKLDKAREQTDQTIQQMQQDAAEAQKRSDTIIMQLTRQVETLTEQNQLLLEDNRPKRRWYQRLLVWNNA